MEIFQISMIPYLKQILASIGLHLERHSTHDERLNTIIELWNSQFSLLRILENVNTLKRVRYGFIDTGNGTFYPVPGRLYPDQYTGSGFFVSLSKLLITVLECQQQQIAIRSIDNTLCMEMYKDCSFHNNWPAFFQEVEAHRAEMFALEKLPCEKEIARNISPHSDYNGILHALGHEWIVEFLDIYCKPSLFSSELSQGYKASARIMETKPLAVYYRGTDKFLEIEPVSPSQVFSYVDSHSGSGQAILIQTDQQQVRDYARNHYLDRCRFIEDIPVTKGSVGIHYLSDHSVLREYSGQQLVVMAESIAHGPTIVTTTSNVGVFLPLKIFSRGGTVFQIKSTSKEQANRSSI